DPCTPTELRESTGLPDSVLHRHGRELLDLLAEQREVPDMELPPLLPAPLDAAQREQVKQLKVQVREIASKLAVAPEILVPSKDYELLLREIAGEVFQPPVHWNGWRKEAVLAPLRQSMAGHV
ncbi:MAG TPA: ribonuclease D, partial [Halioglobus sp.]